MAKDLLINVVARKDSVALSELATEFDKLSKSVDNNGKSLQKNASFSKFLDNEIARTKVQVGQLGDAFEKTGSKDLFAGIKAAQKNLAGLERIKKQLSSAVESGFEDGSQQGVKFLGNAFGSLPPQAQLAVGAVVVGGIAATSTAIGAALSGVLLAGVGGAGIAAGIIGQIHDPAVKTALTELKDTASTTLTKASTAFGPVLIDAAHEFRDAFIKAEPTIEKALDKLAPHADKVFQGLELLGEKAAPGFLKALDASGPILDELGKDLPELGKSFGQFFDSVSGGAGGARDGLHSLFVVTEDAVVATGYLLEGLSKGYEGLVGFGDLLTGDVGSAVGRFSELVYGSSNGSKDLAGKLAKAAIAADDMAGSVGKLNGQLSTLITKQLDVSGANDAFQRGLNDLGQALDQNNHTLVGNSDAAIQNRDAIRQLITEAAQARDKQIEMAGGANASKAAIDKANASYDQAITKIEDVGTKAGLSKKDLDNLAGNYQVNVLLAIDAINNSGLAQNVAPHDPNRKGNKRARGGPVTAGMPYIVGEHRPELFIPDVSGRIAPQIPAPVPYLRPQAGGWRGGGGSSGPVQATLAVSGGGGTGLGSLISELIRTGQIQLFVDASGAVRSSN